MSITATEFSVNMIQSKISFNFLWITVKMHLKQNSLNRFYFEDVHFESIWKILENVFHPKFFKAPSKYLVIVVQLGLTICSVVIRCNLPNGGRSSPFTTAPWVPISWCPLKFYLLYFCTLVSALAGLGCRYTSWAWKGCSWPRLRASWSTR